MENHIQQTHWEKQRIHQGKFLHSEHQLINLSFFSQLYLQSRISFGSTTSLTSPGSVLTVSKIIFIIDDIHFADESSLKYLLTLGSHRKCLLILSMKPPRNNNNDRTNSNILQSISTDSRVYLRRLPGLELRYLATLGKRFTFKLKFLYSFEF